jgi:type IV secretory pathway VirB2 component (pilin)
MQPATSSVFAAALWWLQGTLLGTIATTMAVIAVASVGLLLLSGRVELRRASRVIFGCFILFGASTIASGIVRAVRETRGLPEAGAPPPAAYVPPAAPAPLKAAPYDPYAGAAIPPRP